MIKNMLRITGNITYLREKRIKILALITLVSMIFSLTGCFLIPKEEEVLAPILKEPPKVAYNTLEIKTGTFEKKVQVTGYFVSVSQKDLSFQNLSGRLKTIYVKLGDEVKKGTLLAELITDDLENQIKQQEINLKKSQLNLSTLKSNGNKDMYLLEKQLNSLRTELENMEFTSEAYSKQEIKNFKDQIEEKEILYKNSREVYQNNIKVSENDLDLCKLQLATLVQKRNNAKLVSPIDGTIDYLTEIKVGSTIDAYTTVATVADPKNLQVGYSEDKVSQFDLGMKVALKIHDSKTEGEVVMTPSNVPLEADEKTKNSIRIKMSNIPSDISIGDSVEITLLQIKKDDVIVINKNLIRAVGARKFVNVLEKGLKKERDIETGDESQTETVVVKGLSVGDLVIKN